MKHVMKVDTGASGIQSRVVDYPSNSKIKKVTKSKVLVKKEKPSAGFLKSFINEDFDSVKDYIFNDVLKPTLKSLLADIVKGGIEKLLYGEVKNNKSSRHESKFSYDRCSEPTRASQPNRSSHNFDDITFTTRYDAERVLSDMTHYIRTYGQVSVSDFYDYVGITPEWTDEEWGWTNLRGTNVRPVRNGYILTLPRTERLR